MKATLDIPDDLYRRVKARSAMEGRPLRSVAIELFQSWLHEGEDAGAAVKENDQGNAVAEFPWLAITRKYVKPGIPHDMKSIGESIERGWAGETTGESCQPSSRA